MQIIPLDVLIIGGGVAGLWLQRRLQAQGYGTLLVEQEHLGGGQTVCAQGIIHGGTKYALNGLLTPAANQIAAMPGRWRNALQGHDDVSLVGARVLSDAHYMWSTGGLSSRITSFFASKAMHSRVERIDPQQVEVFRSPQFHGQLYQLNEWVVDVPSVVTQLHMPGRALKAKAGVTLVPKEGHWVMLGADIAFAPQVTVLTAGAGTAGVLEQLRLDQPMQRRPLHMVMVKLPPGPSLFAHCIGPSSLPLATITTHPHPDGSRVWYIGGQLAEAGVDRSEGAQVDAARALLGQLLPWISLQGASFATLRVDRAEPLQIGFSRPDCAFARREGQVVVCWPTKLALAPDLADQVLPLLPPPRGLHVHLPDGLPEPQVARPVWEAM